MTQVGPCKRFRKRSRSCSEKQEVRGMQMAVSQGQGPPEAERPRSMFCCGAAEGAWPHERRNPRNADLWSSKLPRICCWSQ